MPSYGSRSRSGSIIPSKMKRHKKNKSSLNQKNQPRLVMVKTKIRPKAVVLCSD